MDGLNQVFLDRIVEMLHRHEGLRLNPYHCSANKLTIGIGRNLQDRGITESEAFYLLHGDINLVQEELTNKKTHGTWQMVRSIRRSA